MSNKKQKSLTAFFQKPTETPTQINGDIDNVDEPIESIADLASSATTSSRTTNTGTNNTIVSNSNNSSIVTDVTVTEIREAGKGTKRKFMPSWTNEYSWLVYDEVSQSMHCEYCRKAGSYIAGKSDFDSGVSTFKKESIVAHNKSKRHEKCVSHIDRNIKHPSQYAILKSFETGQNTNLQKSETELKIKFNTAYVISKEEMSFTKYKTLLLMQKKNGLDISATYDNDVRCAEIISTISEELKSSRLDQLQSTNFISIMIDGATDRATAENEVVYVRFIENGKPVNCMISLCELQHANATGVIEGIHKAFSEFGLQNYHEKLIGFCADGASVNLGQTGGVVAKLRETAAHLIDIHCMAHRLELSLLELKNKNTLMKTLNDVLHLIWKTYKNSPKSKRELNTLGSELDSKVYSPAPVKGTRWLPHIDRALKVFIDSKGDIAEQPSQYAVIYAHMEHLGLSSKTAEMQGRGRFVSKEMGTFTFITFAHFICDVFAILSKVSLNFQKSDLILPLAISVGIRQVSLCSKEEWCSKP